MWPYPHNGGYLVKPTRVVQLSDKATRYVFIIGSIWVCVAWGWGLSKASEHPIDQLPFRVWVKRVRWSD